MGGYGSGNHGSVPTVEDGLVLSVASLRRDSLLAAGRAVGTLRWTETRSGREVASVGFERDVESNFGRLRLRYTTTRYDGEKRQADYIIALETTRQPFGGLRWWFRCPLTNVRAAKLYLPPGAPKFAARQAFRRLPYRSQRAAPYDRALNRAFRLRHRLGDYGGIGDFVMKPKWMRWATFESEKKKIEAAEDRVNTHLLGWLTKYAPHLREEVMR